MQFEGSKIHIFFLHTWRDLGQRIKEQTRPTLSWTLRLTVAATAAYLVALQFFDDHPLMAPLSALLVTQLTLYSVVRNGIKRVVSCVIGVGIATMFASVVGLTWWSLAIAIAVGLLVAQLLRLGDHVIEVPVTAMFVMAVQSGTTAAAMDRVVATVIGAVVGLLINVLFPPAERSPSAAAAIRRYAEDIAGTIKTALAQMDGEITREQAQAWLDRARLLDYKTVHIDRMIDHAEEARVLNIRAINRPDAISSLRTGLYALEHSAVVVRGIFRGISDAVWYPDEDVEDALPEPARALARQVLDDIAEVVNDFGILVEAHVHAPTVKSEAALLNSLTRLQDSRLLTDKRLDSKEDLRAVRELLAFIVVAAGRISREFDPENYEWLVPTAATAKKRHSRAVSAAKEVQAQLHFRRPTPRSPSD